MINVPAFCPHCSTISFHSNLVGGNAAFTFVGGKITCPVCRKMANIIDGTYTDLVIKTVLDSGINESDYQKFSQIFEDAKKTLASVEEVAESIKSEVPKLSPVIAFLKVDFGLIPILALIASIIGIYLNLLSLNKTEQITNEQILDELKKLKPTPQTNTAAKPKKKSKPRPNELCSCGSGRKSKKCCGSKG